MLTVAAGRARQRETGESGSEFKRLRACKSRKRPDIGIEGHRALASGIDLAKKCRMSHGTRLDDGNQTPAIAQLGQQAVRHLPDGPFDDDHVIRRLVGEASLKGAGEHRDIVVAFGHEAGRRLLSEQLPGLKSSLAADICIVNGENSAGGLGIDPGCAGEIYAAGADVITTGNHVWGKKAIFPYLDENKHRIVRPANFRIGAPGVGSLIYPTKSGVRVAVMNFIGRVFTGELVDCPFAKADELLSGIEKEADLVFIDFHGEATSEKIAFGYHVSSRAQVVVGTHTHVQTADERILPGGTAYISDVGMCGPYESVIGVDKEAIIERFRTGRPTKFEVAKGNTVLNGVLVELDISSREARAITRINEVFPQ